MGFASTGRFAVFALLAAAPWQADAGTTSAFTLSVQTYSGSRERQYKVYVPDGLTGPAPMVMVLHGCQQTHDDVLRDWGLTAAADRNRFVLVAPFITSYDGLRNTNCWGFWLDQHRHQGRGEPEDLHQIARQVEARFAIDPKRRYVTGLSSGAAMAVVLSVTHNEYFAAAASASGLPYGEDSASVSFSGCPGSATFHAVSRVVSDMRAERNASYAIPLMVLQNNRDCTVVQPAGRNLRAISTGDLRDIGFAWDYFFTRVTLHQGEGGRWYVQAPAGCG
ncbi:PHB depolymerase family esterase [Variovorax sp. KK3]|uniref:extracellular catalytic domain type 1 short-chain-length polyhydroxyalkanoate depolymerase n=1 Tax=Variovorax sp. KK3 TaxID=1855728 RepID=UPI003AB0B85D